MLLVAGKVSGDVIKGCWEGPPGAASRSDTSGIVLLQQESANLSGKNSGYPRHPTGSKQHLLCAIQCTRCKGKGAESFWLWLGGWDKRTSVCQSVFPRSLRSSPKHKLGSLMNLSPSHGPLLRSDIVNQANYRGTHREESVSFFVSAEEHLMLR